MHLCVSWLFTRREGERLRESPTGANQRTRPVNLLWLSAAILWLLLVAMLALAYSSLGALVPDDGGMPEFDVHWDAQPALPRFGMPDAVPPHGLPQMLATVSMPESQQAAAPPLRDTVHARPVSYTHLTLPTILLV